MEQEYKELLYRLKTRFDSGYEEYKKEVLELDKEQIFESASEILAVKETHMEMCFWMELSLCEAVWPNGFIQEPIGERDARRLLSMEEPLKDLAMKWWFYTLGGKADFHDFYREVGCGRREV